MRSRRQAGPDAGSYRLEAGVRDFEDPTHTFSSKLLLDGVSSAAPEPAVWGLMTLGFAGLGGLVRARRARAAQGA